MDAVQYQRYVKKLRSGEYTCVACPHKQGYYWIKKEDTPIRYIGPRQFTRIQSMLQPVQQQ